MEIRFFQIFIPIVALYFLYLQVKEYRNNVSGIYETILILIFWAGVLVLAMFPDFVSDMIARMFGIKDNVNALIFFALGLLIYFQLKMFKTIKRQDKLLTELTRKVALDNFDSK